MARAFQHEIDHLYGVLMTDKAEQLYKLVENEEGEYEAVPIEEAWVGTAKLQVTGNKVGAKAQ
ncbi:MAG: peptide deformylase [Caldilineaceae bacterium]